MICPGWFIAGPYSRFLIPSHCPGTDWRRRGRGRVYFREQVDRSLKLQLCQKCLYTPLEKEKPVTLCLGLLLVGEPTIVALMSVHNMQDCSVS